MNVLLDVVKVKGIPNLRSAISRCRNSLQLTLGPGPPLKGNLEYWDETWKGRIFKQTAPSTPL